MAASSRAQVLRLYRALLRESQRFSCYGYSNRSQDLSELLSFKPDVNSTFRVNVIREEILAASSHVLMGGKGGGVYSFSLLASRGQKVLPSLITYAIRRIKDAFRENKNITDSEKIEELLNKAKANLQVIQRQVTIGQMYATEKLIIECPEDIQPRKASEPETTLGHLQHPTVPRTETAHAHV